MAEANKKQIAELMFNNDIYYHNEHTWAKVEGNKVTIGITDFAQDQLGEIIFIELPSIGDEFEQGAIFGQAESAKTISSLYMPLSGQVVSVNEELEDDPEIVNNEPYAAGWMIVAEINDSKEIEQLLSKEQYMKMLKDNQE